jgi:O-antigen ligase
VPSGSTPRDTHHEYPVEPSYCRAAMTAAPRQRGYRFGERTQQSLVSLFHRALPAVLAAATVGGLAAANGGYFNGTCAWASLGLLWFAAVAIVLRSKVELGALELVLLGALVLFAGWSALSILWTSSVTLTVFDVQKLLVYLSLVLAALLVLRSRTVPWLLAGVLAGIVAVCTYALATRLLPERLGNFDPLAGYRLETPVGYWNALGLFAAVGVLLAAGLAVRADRPWSRAAAAAPLPLLMATFFFTFSRGAWVALAFGILAVCALDPRRLHLLAGLLALAPTSLLAVVLADRSHALTSATAVLSDATREGHRLALWIVFLAAASAAVAFTLGLVEARVRIPRVARIAFAGLLVLGLASAVAAAVVHWGSPSSLAIRAYDSFRAPPKSVHGNLAGRLLSLSSNGRIDLWHAAWREFVHHPLAGTGAGTYQQWWYATRPYPAHVLDAHGLYQQTLGELGVVGFVVLLVLLVAPLIAAVKARRNPFVPVACGAYVAFLVHNAVDWDWELTGVEAAGLLCGVALVVSARPYAPRLKLALPVRVTAVAATVALVAFAFVSMLGNVPLDSAQAAADRGDWAASAADAIKARRWAPWSSEPWRLLGEAQLAQGRIASAGHNFRVAAKKDPESWQVWVDLALATSSTEKRHALAIAERLDPRDPNIPSLARQQLIFPGA